MINIDYSTLKEFFNENIDFFIGARLQKIQQPSRRDLILHLRNNSESRKFYININPQYYHVAFLSKENEAQRGFKIPKQPPMFCMLLRKYLEGSKIIDALVIDNERILELHFDTYDEISQIHKLCLGIELMGKHSNIILYDKTTSIIIGCAHNIGAEKSKFRELKGGLKYVYPPKVNTLDKISNPLYQILNKNSDMITINQLLDDYFAKIQAEANLKTKKEELIKKINSNLKKTVNTISKLSKLLNERKNSEIYKLYGELLLANLYQKTDFQKEIEVFNYNTNENITIKLDETKTLKENAQVYFKLYTKNKVTKEKTDAILQTLINKQQYLESILYSINIAQSSAELENISDELNETKVKNTKELPIVTKINTDNFDVYIGKNNKQNDYIVSKLMKDNDYWFHVKNCAGSHVLLKIHNTQPSENVIFQCCKLAREYSSAKQPSKVGVIYTIGKYVKKIPNSHLGHVTYSNEKEILI